MPGVQAPVPLAGGFEVGRRADGIKVSVMVG